jgi:uncharacterized protein (DUF2249 family)
MASEPVIDVRTIPHARRHVTIFETFAALEPGAGFEIHVDHDPKPLYYHFSAEQPGAFTWEWLEQGPDVWRVRLGRAAQAAAS